MTQAQLQMAAQQQLAPLQQQQAQQAQQAQQQAAAAVAHVQAAQQLAAQQQQFQNLVQGGGHPRMDTQQYQQLQLRQLAQANMNRAQGATTMINQANAIARAQAQMHVQQQQQMGGQPMDVSQSQQQQLPQQIPQQGMNFGSPRPPPVMQPPQQGVPNAPVSVNQNRQRENMIQTIARLSAMPEAQREQIFKTVSSDLVLSFNPPVDHRSTLSSSYHHPMNDRLCFRLSYYTVSYSLTVVAEARLPLLVATC